MIKRFYLCVANDGHSEIVTSSIPPTMGIWTSISAGAETLEESQKIWDMPDAPCVICGSKFSTRWCEPYRTRCREKNVCFTCLHWLDLVEIKDDPKNARIDGEHYQIEPESNCDPRFKGMHGRTFTIKFNDGRSVKTTNLWHQGTIPERFRAQLPNNAIFVF